MDTMTAWGFAQAASFGARKRVFDWDKAAQILRDRNPQHANAGLQDDMEWTGGAIWCDRQPFKEGYTYLCSTWATPILEIDGEEIECWKYQDETPQWHAATKWPESALKILGEV